MKPLKAIIPAAVLLTPACASVQSGDMYAGEGAVMTVEINDAPPKIEKSKEQKLREESERLQAGIDSLRSSCRENTIRVDKCLSDVGSCPGTDAVNGATLNAAVECRREVIRCVSGK